IRTRTDSGNLAPSVMEPASGTDCADSAHWMSSQPLAREDVSSHGQARGRVYSNPAMWAVSGVARGQLPSSRGPLDGAQSSPAQSPAQSAWTLEGGPMSVDVKQPRSRRALLAGLAGAAGALATGAIHRLPVVCAADGG